jgi:hypothetical protein
MGPVVPTGNAATVGCRCRPALVRGRCGAAETTVFESVAVALEGGDDFGAVDEAVDHGSGDDFVS